MIRKARTPESRLSGRTCADHDRTGPFGPIEEKSRVPGIETVHLLFFFAGKTDRGADRQQLDTITDAVAFTRIQSWPHEERKFEDPETKFQPGQEMAELVDDHQDTEQDDADKYSHVGNMSPLSETVSLCDGLTGG